MDICRRCHVRKAFTDGLCIECQGEINRERWERQREREIDRELAEEREYEHQQELLEQQERHQQELLEQAERHHQEMLDVTLPWFPCSHCGTKTRQDKIKEVDGKKFCGDCADRIRECQFCGKRWVTEPNKIRKIFYAKNPNFSKRSSEIEYAERKGLEPNLYVDPFCQPQQCLAKALNDFKLSKKDRSMSYTSYDGIRKFLFYMCPSCREKSQDEQWETSSKLKVEYDKLKAAKEKADREEKERQEREAERKRREEQARREREEAEEKAREKAKKKNDNMNVGAGCLGVFLLVAILIISYVKDGDMRVAFGIGVGSVVLSILLKKLTFHLFAGLLFALVLSPVCLAIGVVCYFVWDVFLIPLVISLLVILVLFTILSATGVIDTTSGETPIDSLHNLIERFQ